ncbi:hypothetical protein [Campylobacter sputorum]|nr:MULTISPECIES: hypothetical protein [Campylobacter]
MAAFIAGLPLFVKPLQASIELFPSNVIDAAILSGKNRLQTLIF